MKKLFAFLSRHDSFTLSLITGLLACCWAFYFALDLELGKLLFVSSLGLMSCIWTVLITGSIMNWPTRATK